MDTATSFITAAQLFKTLGSAAAPLLLDVRSPQAFQADSRMLASATWRDPAAVTDWRKYLPVHRDIVVAIQDRHIGHRLRTVAGGVAAQIVAQAMRIDRAQIGPRQTRAVHVVQR